LEREKEIATRHESELRLTLLRKKQQGLDPTDVVVAQPQHVNLFQAEEEASLRNIVGGTDEKKVGVAGVMPVSLGQTALKTRGDRRPFYLRESEQVKELSANETRRQDILDPMRKFSKRRREKKEPQEEEEHEDRRRHRKRQKKSKKESKGKSSSSSNKGQDSLQELRRRRQEREAHESIRASALFGGGAADQGDDRKRPYHNQFNPGRSRK
jgi:hypothetical protein